jgi:hypothetical protein
MLVAACVAPSGAGNPACRPLVVDRLYFGLAMPGGAVSEVQWTGFLESEITPRFPDGLTLFQAQGQWREAGGSVLREPSRVVEVVHEEGAREERSIEEIVAAYKARFRQESVLRLRTGATACF